MDSHAGKGCELECTDYN